MMRARRKNPTKNILTNLKYKVASTRLSISSLAEI